MSKHIVLSLIKYLNLRDLEGEREREREREGGGGLKEEKKRGEGGRGSSRGREIIKIIRFKWSQQQAQLQCIEMGGKNQRW